MEIQRIKNYNNKTFNARIYLNDKRLLCGTSLCNKKNEIDQLFNENKFTTFLNSSAKYLKENILYKNGEDTTNKVLSSFVKVLIGISRKIADKLYQLEHYSSIKKITSHFKNIQIDSPEYIREIATIGNSTNKFIDINEEDGILDKIVHSKTPTIFILNHPNYIKDRFVYIALSTLLAKKYVKNGLEKTCPRTKIIASKNILKPNKKLAYIYTKLGLIPVDANIRNKNAKFNALSIKPIFAEFLKNKTNLFIFPEGNNSILKNKTLSEKIQKGISSLIIKGLEFCNEIQVVSVGIDYSNCEKNSLGKLHLGNPIILEKGKKNQVVIQNSSQSNSKEEINNSDLLKFICNKLEEQVKMAKNRSN